MTERRQAADVPGTVCSPGQGSTDSTKRATDHSVVADGIERSVVVTGNHNSVQVNAGPPRPSGLREAYLQYILKTARRLSLEGVDPKAVRGAEEDRELSLDGVYTGLRTLPGRRHVLVESPDPDLRQKLLNLTPSEPSPVLVALDGCDRLVLLGDPGSGKSTFVAFVALCLAAESLGQDEIGIKALTRPLPAEDSDSAEKQGQPQRWRHGALLPVRVVLRDFAARGLPPEGDKAKAKHLLGFIHDELASCCDGDFTPDLDDELRNQGALVLLDGLDEVPEADQRRGRIKDAIVDFGAAFPKCRLLVTSRTYAYRKQGWRLAGFEERELAPFSRGQIAEFVQRWYAQVDQIRRRSAEDSEGRARMLFDAIAGNTRLAELASRPLLLTLMASLHAWRGGTLPQRREELYSDAVDLLLERWEAQRIIRDKTGKIVNAEPSLTEWLRVDRDHVRELLDEVAFHAHARQPELLGTADVPAGELIDGLLRLTKDPDLKPAQVVEYLNARAGLLLPRGDRVFTFPHRTFQEYLAACHLTLTDYPTALGDLVRADPERWREVALLAGAKAGRGAPFALWALVEDLIPVGPGDAEDARDQLTALIAGQALAESAIVEKIAKKDQAKLERARKWLRAILEGDTLPAKLRAEAGDVLATLGDPRFRDSTGLCLPADEVFGFVEIPAGPFLMGSDKVRGKWTPDSEQPQHQLDLPSFLMARFPVTVAQFCVFLGSAGTKLEDENGLRMPATRPMTCVSLDEARSYCAWLDQELRLRRDLPPRLSEALKQGRIALPSEAEWEKGARGGDGRRFPWGDDGHPERANASEEGIGTTSAVGCFRSGASPFGCEDISGNVWEWTRSRFQSYPYPTDSQALQKREAAGGRQYRVVRGGSFHLYQGLARAAFRFNVRPAVRNNSLGFRVVVSPSVSDP